MGYIVPRIPSTPLALSSHQSKCLSIHFARNSEIQLKASHKEKLLSFAVLRYLVGLLGFLGQLCTTQQTAGYAVLEQSKATLAVQLFIEQLSKRERQGEVGESPPPWYAP